MKPAVNKALAVGILVAATGAAFLIAFSFFKKGGYSEKDSYETFVYFRDATGLTWKSRVQIAGIQVGEVNKIELEGDRARLTLRIKKAVGLHTDACLTKSFPSALLPDALLEATSGSADRPLIASLPEDKREITCIRESTSMQALLEALSRIAADVQVVTSDLAKTVGGDQGSLRTIIENVSRITRQLDTLVSENGRNLSGILSDARSFTSDLRQMSNREKERIHQITVNVEDITRQLRSVLGSVQSILEGAPASGGRPFGEAPDLEVHVLPVAMQAAGTPETAQGAPGAAPEPRGLRQAVDRLNSGLAKLDELMSKVNEGKSAAGRILTDERMGRQIGSAVEGVSDYVDRLTRLQIEMHLRSEWLLNQSGAKTYFGARLLPRPDKYYLFEIVSDPHGIDTQTTETVTTDTVDANGNRTTGTTIATKTVHEDKLTFSLQLAKRYGPITFRAGVIESSGGVGSDFHLLDDRLQISMSIYQFNRPYTGIYPRAKIWMNWNLLQYFYVSAGADDFLNKWKARQYPFGPKFKIGNDVFFGGGLVFTDDDLKTLVGAGAGSAAGAVK